MVSSQQSSQHQPVSDDDREHIAEEIAAALLLLYHGKRSQVLAQLGAVDAGDVPGAAVQKINAFATDRAQKIQTGINSRMLGADNPAEVAQSIADYNATVLQPYMQRWAQNSALVDTYRTTPDPMASASSAAQAHDWQWTRFSGSDEPDECGEAEGLGPASLDDILGITGSVPPVHPRCQCSLDPV